MLSGVDETPEEWKARMGVGQRSHVAQLVGGDGTTRTEVLHADGGRIAGTQTEHWSGQQDAVAFPETVRMKAKPQEVGR